LLRLTPIQKIDASLHALQLPTRSDLNKFADSWFHYRIKFPLMFDWSLEFDPLKRPSAMANVAHSILAAAALVVLSVIVSGTIAAM
jgi:hypothetical protein